MTPFIHLTLDCILHFLTLSFQPCFPHHYLISDDQQSPQSVVTHPRNRSSVSHTRALMDTCIPHQHFVSLSMSAPQCACVCGGGILISDSIYHVQSILRLAADWEEWGRVYWSGGVYRIERSSDAPEYGTAGGNKIEEEDRAVNERWTTASNLRAVRCLTRNPH